LNQICDKNFFGFCQDEDDLVNYLKLLTWIKRLAMLFLFLEQAYSRLDLPWSVQASTLAPAPIKSRTTPS
jgi:hypothetical protein